MMHDWDGLTDYEVRRAHMLADMDYSIIAAGLPHEMVTYSGAPHAFTVFGSKRYREDADKKSWAQFGEYLQATLN